MPFNNSRTKLLSNLIENALCIGCGACSVTSPKISIKMNKDGFYRAVIDQALSDQENTQALEICPFSDSSLNEDQLADKFMPELPFYAPVAGKYISSCVVSLNDESLRLQSTSSGFTTWILENLLKSKEIDGVIHVSGFTNKNESSQNYLYSISTSISDIRAKSKTRYYPVELSHVLKTISSDQLVYAVVGLPCFISAIQNMRSANTFWQNKIKFTISLFCGHLKSRHFTSHILDNSGIASKEVKDLDYRSKSPKWSASNYISSVSSDSRTSYLNLNKIPAASWATGAFKYFACNFCDDILGESADVSIGDAWMDPFKNDWKGHNNVIVRNSFIYSLMISGSQNGELNMIEKSVDYCTYGAAKGGITDRRDGLAYRLSIMDSEKLLRPQKRIQPSTDFSRNRRELIAIKMLFGLLSTNLYTLTKARSERLLFLVPTYILEFWYKFVRKLGLPFCIIDIILRLCLRYNLLRR